ncbi:MAG: TldD/PmbA family protein [Asgard group archaeon]|nr:TldD/PmbA family protein [Asgard group archaeon]
MPIAPFAADAVEYALKSDADYVDIRVENEFSSFTGMRNNAICGVNSNLQESIGIRVLFNNCWGFASVATLETSAIKKAIENAMRSAKKVARLSSNPAIKLAEISQRKTSVSDDCQKEPQFLEVEERLELLNRINNRITSQVEVLKVLDLKLIENQTQKLFMNSEGSEIEQILIRSSLFFGSLIKGSGNFQKVRTQSFGGVGGIEQFEKIEFENFLYDFIKLLPELSQSKLVKPKEQPIILNEEMGWNLCHEFCHAVESDLILKNLSPLGDKIGTKLGSEKVTIIDDASFNGYGEYYFDDEGVKASGTLIIEDGILFDVLQNRETAGEMEAVPTSNGRAESCLYSPQVRQSNTFFEPGNSSFEELLEITKNGLFICDSFGGNADTVHGNFQLDAQYGRKIEKGELTDFVTGFSIIGNLYTILGDVIGLTKDFMSFPAYCGKNGQRVSVGAISPKVALKRAAVISNIAQRQIRKIDFSRLRES